MSSTYINTAFPTGYTLSGNYDVVTFGLAASVGGAGVVANSAATIENLGTIDGSTANGVALSNGGDVINSGTAALIEGDSAGVLVTGVAGTVTNAGTIESLGQSGFGIAVDGLGYVTNSGLIDAAGGGKGIYFESGGRVTNNAGGTIEASGSHGYGIDFSGSGSVVNSGLIEATGTGGIGVYLKVGGNVTNGGASDSTALIEGGAYGVDIAGAPGTVVNYGTISGTADAGVHLGYYSNGGSVVNGTTLDTAALVTGYIGVAFNFGTVINDGSVVGVFAGIDGRTGKVVNGGTNDTTALIKGGSFGVDNIGGNDTLVNFGTVAGRADVHYGYAVTFGGGNDTITNGGTGDTIALITGGSGIGIGTATSGGGTVVNFGSIVSTAGDTVKDSSTYHGIGISLEGDGSITNSLDGVIEASGSLGLGVRFETTGTLTNLGTIEASGTGGIAAFLYSGASISNDGTIEGTGTTGWGVYARYFSSITNNVGGVISSAGNGAIGMRQSGGTVVNVGTISATSTAGFAIYLGNGSGTIDNQGSGLIEGHVGVYIGSTSHKNTVNNAGTIKGSGATGSGISLVAGGLILMNEASGLIEGSVGVRSNVPGYPGNALTYSTTVTNYGTIDGTGGTAVQFLSALDTLVAGAGGDFIGEVDGGGGSLEFKSGSATGTIDGVTNFGTVTFDSGASWEFDAHDTISGGLTVAGGTVIVGGTMDNGGVGANALDFASGTDLLVVKPGADFVGAVVGDGAGSMLRLGGAGTDGTLSGLGSGTLSGSVIATLSGFATYAVGTLANWTLTGSNSIGSGTAFDVGGTLTVANAGSLANNGLIEVNAGVFIDDTSLSGAGTIGITNSGTVELLGGASGTTVDFNDGSVLELSDPTGVTIKDFAAGDTIALTGVTYSPSNAATYNSSLHEIIVSGAGGNTTLDVSGTTLTSGESLTVVSDGTISAIEVVCFLEGTRVRTARGEISVEALAEGDLVVTVSGALEPVKWIGKRRVNAKRHPSPEKVYPIRIKRNAFADGVPTRDLLVSPGHAIYAGGILIPAHRLVNGVTIFQDFGIAEPHYFHIELAQHGILLAEGLAAESYLDSGNRGFFENGGSAIALFALPDDMRQAKGRCAPLKNSGAEATAIKQILLRRVRALGYVPVRRAELRLEIDGRTVQPATVKRGTYRFELPLHYQEVRLVSQTSTAGATRAANFDVVPLGVAVLDISHGTRSIDLHDLRAGWHQLERDGAKRFRWTDGNALLPVAGPGTLEIRVLRPAERWLRQVELVQLWRA